MVLLNQRSPSVHVVGRVGATVMPELGNRLGLLDRVSARAEPSRLDLDMLDLGVCQLGHTRKDIRMSQVLQMTEVTMLETSAKQVLEEGRRRHPRVERTEVVDEAPPRAQLSVIAVTNGLLFGNQGLKRIIDLITTLARDAPYQLTTIAVGLLLPVIGHATSKDIGCSSAKVGGQTKGPIANRSAHDLDVVVTLILRR